MRSSSEPPVVVLLVLWRRRRMLQYFTMMLLLALAWAVWSGIFFLQEDFMNNKNKNNNRNKNTKIVTSTQTTTTAPPHTKVYSQELNWGLWDLHWFLQKFFEGKNVICDLATEFKQAGHSTTLIHITLSCSQMIQESGLGSGNFLVGIYGMRLAAQLSGTIDLWIQCTDVDTEHIKSLIVPWATGFFASSPPESKRLRSLLSPAERKQVCGGFWSAPVGRLYHEYEYELRRMALALVGIPSTDSPIYNAVTTWIRDNRPKDASHLQLGHGGWLPLSYEDDDGKDEEDEDDVEDDTFSSGVPLFRNVELDDTMIHFRCGDLMNSTHPHYGFMPYRAFVDPIYPQSRSIGIVTQPFDPQKMRRQDMGTGERCRVVVTDFVRYVQDRFPKARVTIHNGRNESLAVTFARMILVNQTITGVGTFGIFPAMVSFGRGFARKPDQIFVDTLWLLDTPLQELGINLVLMEEPNMLMVKQMSHLWKLADGEAKILYWFRHGSFSK